MRLKEATKKVEDSFKETLADIDYLDVDRSSIRTNNVIVQLTKDICHRTRIVGVFHDGNLVLMLIYTRLKEIGE